MNFAKLFVTAILQNACERLLLYFQALVKDTHREKNIVKENSTLTESTMWVAGTSNQLFIRGPLTEKILKKKKKCSYRQNSVPF